jgi:hypothetical protein
MRNGITITKKKTPVIPVSTDSERQVLPTLPTSASKPVRKSVLSRFFSIYLQLSRRQYTLLLAATKLFNCDMNFERPTKS